MKFTLSFKQPDVLARDQLIDEASWAIANKHGIESLEELVEVDQMVDEANDLVSEMQAAAGKWLWYQEVVTIEFDTKTGTATVVRP